MRNYVNLASGKVRATRFKADQKSVPGLVAHRQRGRQRIPWVVQYYSFDLGIWLQYSHHTFDLLHRAEEFMFAQFQFEAREQQPKLLRVCREGQL